MAGKPEWDRPAAFLQVGHFREALGRSDAADSGKKPTHDLPGKGRLVLLRSTFFFARH